MDRKSLDELIKDSSELDELARLMFQEIKGEENTLSRFIRVVGDEVTFINGKRFTSRDVECNLNKENIVEGVFTRTDVDDTYDLYPNNFLKLTVARDKEELSFSFDHKEVSLPTAEMVHFEQVPYSIDMYDNELKDFTKEHNDVRMRRKLSIEQKIIVNSKGGKAIQSVPFFEIAYYHGYEPTLTHRDLTVVCTSDNDLKKLPLLIKYLADPTLDKRIKNAKTFSEAFHELYNLSELKCVNLEDVGIPLSTLYDVIVLSGVPFHEIFGHTFEEPLGESSTAGTFKNGQNIGNDNILLRDNPSQDIEGFRVEGFTYVDAYGRVREPRINIKDGKVVGFLGSEYIEPKMRTNLRIKKSEPFIGNASQYLDGTFPQARMSCTVLDGKTEDVDWEGKILIIAHDGKVDLEGKNYTLSSSECYVMRDGIPLRVGPLQVSGGVNQALVDLHLLNDMSFNAGVCKGLEAIYSNNEDGEPEQKDSEIYVSEFAKSQLWKRQQVYSLPISEEHANILIKK